MLLKPGNSPSGGCEIEAEGSGTVPESVVGDPSKGIRDGGGEEEIVASAAGDAHPGLLGPRSNATEKTSLMSCSGLVYVCWHRRLTVSLDDVLHGNEVGLQLLGLTKLQWLMIRCLKC